MDEEKVKVDAIVVGGGPAGLAAGLTMAAGGLEVIIIERGESSGTKNMGGLLYGTILDTLLPGFYEDAPFERPVSRRSLTYLGEKNHLTLDFGSESWSHKPYNNTLIVYRSRFDRWLAKKAEEAGVNLVEGMVVDDLIYEGSGDQKKVVGVRIRGDEEFYADAVILAEGANALITKKAIAALKLRPGRTNQDFAVGVKEIIGLPREKIEDRFSLAETEGAALDFFGHPFSGTIGGGFLYTGQEAIHLGFVARAESLEKSHLNPNEVLDKFKNHARIKPLLKGGELLEYSAHMIPEGGYDAIGELSAPGLMIAGDSAGFVNMSLYKEGTNHAMESGKLAGETAILAKKKNDFSKASLSEYEKKLQQGMVLRDLKKYRDLPTIMENTPELFSLYPEKIANLLTEYFSVRFESKEEIQKTARKNLFRDLSKVKFLRNIVRARKLL